MTEARVTKIIRVGPTSNPISTGARGNGDSAQLLGGVIDFEDERKRP
jgi:hypothetical protein